jgi:predicted P-loop ATPase
MRKAEVEIIKSFASRQSDDARPAYGHFHKKQKRHSIEVGTTNSDEYLQSQTGNRRFWPLRVHKPIDIDQLRQDRLLLLGEAAAYEAKGETLTLDPELWSAAGAEQEKRRTKDPWEQTLTNIPEIVETVWTNPIEIVKIIHKIDDQERIASAALLTYVLRIAIGQQDTRHEMRLAGVMKTLGWERGPNKITIEGKQVRGYFRWRDTPS